MSLYKFGIEISTIEDRVHSLSDREKKLLESSPYHIFREVGFYAINEDKFKVLYSDSNISGVNIPPKIVIGAMILQKLFGLTDEELVRRIVCDFTMQYALHLTTKKPEEIRISTRTLSRVRSKLEAYAQETKIDLLSEVSFEIGQKIAEFMQLNGKNRIYRTDSMMVAGNCRRLSRLEIVYRTVHKCVKIYHSLGFEVPSLLNHYLQPSDENAIVYASMEPNNDKLAKAIDEADLMLNLMKIQNLEKTEAYTLLERVLNDQSYIDETGLRCVKDGKDISPTSVQNPNNPDSTFRFKAGEGYAGYAANVGELVDTEGNGVIVSADLDSNVCSDSQFLEGVINDIKCKDGNSDDINYDLIADGAYGGKSNVDKANEAGINLLTTNLVGVKTDEIYSEFKIDNDEIVCPLGNKAINFKYNEEKQEYTIHFAHSHCENCKYRNRCKVIKQKKSYVLKLSLATIYRAEKSKELSSEEYKKYAKIRNGVEGIVSVLRRKYKIDRQYARNKIRLKMSFFCIIIAYNITKLVKYCKVKGITM